MKDKKKETQKKLQIRQIDRVKKEGKEKERERERRVGEKAKELCCVT